MWNWRAIEDLARDCNPVIEEAFNNCQHGLDASGKVVNFILTDFPNYPGPGKTTLKVIRGHQ